MCLAAFRAIFSQMHLFTLQIQPLCSAHTVKVEQKHERMSHGNATQTNTTDGEPLGLSGRENKRKPKDPRGQFLKGTSQCEVPFKNCPMR
jgi:hypothetical protein